MIRAEKLARGTTFTSGQLREQAAVVGHDVKQLAKVATRVAGQKLQHGYARAKEFEKTTEEKIRQHPIRSVLIAAGVGVLVGYLIRRRRT